jgi:glycosyltransferase involved in cell wall biosynthesis
MSAKLPLLSIVSPAFQEEEVLPLFHRELAVVLAQLKSDFRIEIIYVDDGSRDGTLAVIKDLAAQDERVRYLSLSRNFGHQAALTAGLEHARGDIVITMDSDLQHPPAIILPLLTQWRQGHDVVLTIRAEDERLGLIKRLTSKLFYRVMGALSDTDIRMAASDFRLMTRKAVNGLLQLKERHRFLRGMVQWLGFPAAEVHFEPAERKAGHTKYTLRRMLRLAGDGLFSFSVAPMRLAVYAGALAILLGLGHCAWFFVSLIIAPENTPGSWTYVIVTIDLLGGAILMALGILGEYVGRVFEQVKERPLYVLKDQSDGARSSELPSLRRDAA